MPPERQHAEDDTKTLGDNDFQIVVTVNGPGEVASWLQPLAASLKQRMPQARICVAVVPCVFSSGSEYSVIRAQKNVDATCDIDETMAMILRGRMPAGFAKGAPGFVLHIGGDTIFSILLAKRLGVPALAYGESPIALSSFFDKVYYSGFDKSRSDRGDGRSSVVGEMMIDAARMRCPDRQPLREGPLTIGLYPGSRDYLAKYILPFYAVVAEMITAERPGTRWMLAKSDFLSEDFLRAVPEVEAGRPLDGINLHWEEAEGRRYLKTASGLRIEIAGPADVARVANMAITLPGTNTAELSALGVPMVVTVPTWQAEVVPMPGIAGHIGRVPLIGKYIKRGLGHLILRKIKFMSHPNRRAGRMVVPEMTGHITARQVADKVLSILADDTRSIEDELKAIMGSPGAANRLSGELISYMHGAASAHEVAPAR